MSEQIVHSYVRNKRQQVTQVESDNTIAYIIGGAAIILLAIVYWKLTLFVGLSVSSAYGLKVLIGAKTTETVEAATEPKKKRHYEHRIVVKHYQGKTVRI